ncbi:AAA family ATPase [Chryseobacterium gleum]|uniref:AAA family ATPase n=1 Tax=Chryseobacterium gleum TaxID=250 RepID=UPI00241F416E|nr:AAA family ATPase [Chryseobacterium gleum]
MIKYYHNKLKQISLVNNSDLIPEKNIFSILVGKNGTGKSTLLGNLTSDLIKEVSKRKKYYNDEDHYEYSLFYRIEDSHNFFPSEIISVSTSPFDKFPINRFHRNKNYTYLGLRDVNSTSFGLGYLSKIIGSLIESIFFDNKQASEICNVLEFLGYRDDIHIVLDYVITPQNIEELLKSENISADFDNRSNTFFRRLNRSFFTNSDNSLNERKLNKLIKIVRTSYEKNLFGKRIELKISRYGFEYSSDLIEIESLIFLFDTGILKLRDVLFIKIQDYEKYSIKEASSGEQSIILSILGIASKIKDNCVVLIDEPEICLHPQWQETYINILTQTFDKYRNCQFIIATHSPLIISRLSTLNSFIIDMESGELANARNFVNNSVDFQLANVFNHPGYKNEYLLRIAMNIFSNISKNKKFSRQDFINFKILDEQSQFLATDDPVYDLFKTVVELKKYMDRLIKPVTITEEHNKIISSIGNLSTIWESEEIAVIKKDIRNHYRIEQKILCAYCKYPVSVVYPTNCHIEHIAPKSIYPMYMFEPKNLCVICADCNQIKRDQETINQIPDTIKKKYKTKYPDKSEDFHIVHPHFDKYDDHILIVNGYYIDKASKKGNFTIGACLLNRKFLFVGWEPTVVQDSELVNDFSEFIDEQDLTKRSSKLESIKRKLF